MLSDQHLAVGIELLVQTRCCHGPMDSTVSSSWERDTTRSAISSVLKLVDERFGARISVRAE